MRLISVCSPRGHTRMIKNSLATGFLHFYFFNLLPLGAPIYAGGFAYSNNCISRRRRLRSGRNLNRASLHRWQYPSAWSANWCWMIASWKLKPITRCYTGKGQCDSNLRGRVVPGTKKKKKQIVWKKKIVELSASAMGVPITPHPIKSV